MTKFQSILLFFIFIMISSCQSGKYTDRNKKQSVNSDKKSNTYNPLWEAPKQVTPEVTKSAGAPDNICRNPMQDSKGDFWFPTWDGLYQYDDSTYTKYSFTSKRDVVFSAFEAKDGALWFTTLRSGIYRYTKSQLPGEEITFMNFKKESGLPSDRVYCMLQDQKGYIWLGTDQGLSRYDQKANEAGGQSFVNYRVEDGLSGQKVFAMTHDKTGKIWFATDGGISYYDTTDELAKITVLKDEAGLSFEGTSDVLASKDGSIWFGAGDWLYRYAPTTKQSNKKAFTKIAKLAVQYLYEDSKGNIWISADDPASAENYVTLLPPMTLYRYTPSQNERLQNPPSVIVRKAAEVDHQVFGVIESKDGGIWIGGMVGVERREY